MSFKFVFVGIFFSFVMCSFVMPFTYAQRYQVSSVTLYNETAVYPKTNPEKVKVFRKIPPGNFIEIAEITAQSISWGRIETAFKAKAAELGGDAVYIVIKFVDKVVQKKRP